MFKDHIKLLSLIKDYKRMFILAIVGMYISSFFDVFQYSFFIPMVDIIFTGRDIVVPNPNLPKFIIKIIDKINNLQPTFQFLLSLVGCFTILAFFKNILTVGYQYLMGDISQKIMRDVRNRIYNRIQDLSLDYFSAKRTGELISRITHDVSLIENAISYSVTDLFRQTFTIVFCIIGAVILDPVAALIIFVIFPVIGFPMYKIGRKLRKISKGIQEKMADINSLLIETISGIRLVKAFSSEDYEKERFRRQSHDYYKLRMKAIKRLIIISPISEFIGVLCGGGLVLWYGSRMLNHEISFGIFGMFMATILNIISPIKKLGNVNAIVQQALAANDRIHEILEMKTTVKEAENAQTISEMKKSIYFDYVDFQYDQASGIVLKNINLEVKKGELVAIVGPTGTGKTTLVNLIPRFYDATKGKVLMDGVDLRAVSFKSLRGQIGIVSQETILFNDTVKANIAYGRRDASQSEIESAAKKAFAHQFVSKMPLGYDTIVGDRGFRLSGGEKQRLSIARAILKNPPILILDEATSQLDSESEKFVQEALDELMQGRTVVAIAHRLSTIMKADKIVVLEHGQIVGQGKHEELLKSCALYEKLYRMQFQV